MTLFRTLGLVAMTCALLPGQSPTEDPVMKARTQRAQVQGVNEGDLPPVPKGIIEPPPLPPPEVHVRDMARTTRARTRAADRKAGRIGRQERLRGKTVKGKVARGKAARGKAVVSKGSSKDTKTAPRIARRKKGRRR